MDKRILQFIAFTHLVTSATSAIARFLGSLPALLLVAGMGLLPRRALPANLKNAHSHPSNCRF